VASRTRSRFRLQPYSRADAPYFRSPGFYVRVGGLLVLVGLGLAVLGVRAWSLQVLHGKEYYAEAHQQAYRTVDLIGARGAIVDDRGRLIVGTTGRVVINADADALGITGRNGRWHPTPAGRTQIARLAQFARVRTRSLVTRLKYAVLHTPRAPAVVIENPRPALTNYLQERGNLFPAFKVAAAASRSYPLGSFGSEFLGLLGEISPKELASGAFGHAKSGQLVGQSGVEREYDTILDGGFVRARIHVNALGQSVGQLVVPEAKQPPTLQLSIDTSLQRTAEQAIASGMADSRAAGYHPTGGSAVAIDPWTGAIKAIASYPTYSQKLAATSRGYLARLSRDTTGTPLINRAIAGAYPTGSTFKPIIAEAALSAGIITPYTPLLCSGDFLLGDTVFHNVEAGVNESMTLPTALEQSCDTWFYRLGDAIWAHDPAKKATLIQHWARMFGLGTRPPIDIYGATSGYLPEPNRYFEHLTGTPYYEGQAINLSIGQGALQVSPLQLAVAYSTLINGGTVVRPHVAEAVIQDGKKHKLRFKPVRKVPLSPSTWAIRQGLYLAANSPSGTSGAVFGGFSPTVAGKTGTAQAPPYDDHSWYASWAPSDHPKLVVVVMIEHGGFGATAAAPAAKQIYEAYFRTKP
jgi:penicillin-binding protein 2